jgi:hypothetical protein
MAKKKKIYKVGIDSETYAISLVESPAIEETLVALEEQKPIKIQLADEEKYMVYSAVLVPDKPIYRRNEDGDEFYIEFTKESIEKMAQEYLMNYRQNEITLDHATMANDITLVESWIKTDMYKDKSVAIGLSEDLPIGTWIAGLKVNQIDAWNRIKNGELRGFSVESMISLEEFSKQEQNTNNMSIETNDNMFWDKMKNILSEVFTSLSMSKKDEADIESSETYKITPESAAKELEAILSKDSDDKSYPLSAMTDPLNIELANQSGFTSVEAYLDEVYAIKTDGYTSGTSAQANFEENALPTEPTVEPNTITVQVQPLTEEEKSTIEEGIKSGATEAPKVEEKPQENNAHLEELINSLKEEINALKEMNNGLNDKVKELSKEPSTKPVNTNAKPSGASTYSAWREQMRSMIG